MGGINSSGREFVGGGQISVQAIWVTVKTIEGKLEIGFIEIWIQEFDMLVDIIGHHTL